MSRYECQSCGACGGKCDRCGLRCCIDNMEKHNEIFKLKDEFSNKIYYAKNNLIDICNEIKNNLYSNFGINVEISNIIDKIKQSKNFLFCMENKKQELQNNLDNLTKERAIIKREKLNKINNLNSFHKQKMNEINKEYQEKMKKYEINESKYEEEKLKKKGIIQDLIDEKKVVYIDIDSIIESFVKDEKLKAEKEFDFNKEQIDKKYITKEEILTPQIYNENELQIKNECLNEIKKLNAYSNKIPNFQNWINLYGLNNYIN